MARGPVSAYRTLASASRVAILHRLQAAGRPMRVDDLAAAVGLHVNTTRDHLDRLIAAGFVISEREHRATRGRPRVLYRSVARPAAATADPRQRDQLRRLVLDGYATAHDRTGAHAWDQLAALETHFEDLGFDPDADVERLQVHLRRCPVADLARQQTEMVCSVHLDLTRGVLARAEGPLTAERLEPFVGPRHCILHLAEGPAGAAAADGGPDAPDAGRRDAAVTAAVDPAATATVTGAPTRAGRGTSLGSGGFVAYVTDEGNRTGRLPSARRPAGTTLGTSEISGDPVPAA